MIELTAVYAAPNDWAAREHTPHPVLQGINLSIAAGEQVAVIGPSGAGKTTLLHVLACALRPLAGTYVLNGQHPWALASGPLRALRGQLFLAPQVPPLPPRQRVVTAVLAGALPVWGLGRSLASLFYPQDIEGAHAALEHFGLGERLFDRVDRLSGGERQRVGLARALLSPARLWLVDEPLSALDPQNASLAARALTGLARERSVTLVASLHHVEMALAHFPRIIGLQQGRIVFDAPPAQVSDAMLTQLYQNEPQAPAVSTLPAVPETAVVLQCR